MQHQHTPEYIILDVPPLSIPKPGPCAILSVSISNGFWIGYKINSPTLHSAKKNLEGVYLHSQVVEEYLQTEIDLGRLAGPYSQSKLLEVHTSRFGVIPK